MNTDLFVKGLEKEHQKEMDTLRKDLSYQVWQAKQEQKETVKKVFSVLQIADPWWSGLFESCPEEKIVFKKLQEKMRDLKNSRNFLKKMVNTYQGVFEQISEKDLPSVFKKIIESKLKIEDKNQELIDEKRELCEQHEQELAGVQERVKTVAHIALQTAIGISTKANEAFEHKEEIKKEILEEEKK